MPPKRKVDPQQVRYVEQHRKKLATDAVQAAISALKIPRGADYVPRIRDHRGIQARCRQVLQNAYKYDITKRNLHLLRGIIAFNDVSKAIVHEDDVQKLSFHGLSMMIYQLTSGVSYSSAIKFPTLPSDYEVFRDVKLEGIAKKNMKLEKREIYEFIIRHISDVLLGTYHLDTAMLSEVDSLSMQIANTYVKWVLNETANRPIGEWRMTTAIKLMPLITDSLLENIDRAADSVKGYLSYDLNDQKGVVNSIIIGTDMILDYTKHSISQFRSRFGILELLGVRFKVEEKASPPWDVVGSIPEFARAADKAVHKTAAGDYATTSEWKAVASLFNDWIALQSRPLTQLTLPQLIQGVQDIPSVIKSGSARVRKSEASVSLDIALKPVLDNEKFWPAVQRLATRIRKELKIEKPAPRMMNAFVRHMQAKRAEWEGRDIRLMDMSYFLNNLKESVGKEFNLNVSRRGGRPRGRGIGSNKVADEDGPRNLGTKKSSSGEKSARGNSRKKIWNEIQTIVKQYATRHGAADPFVYAMSNKPREPHLRFAFRAAVDQYVAYRKKNSLPKLAMVEVVDTIRKKWMEFYNTKMEFKNFLVILQWAFFNLTSGKKTLKYNTTKDVFNGLRIPPNMQRMREAKGESKRSAAIVSVRKPSTQSVSSSASSLSLGEGRVSVRKPSVIPRKPSVIPRKPSVSSSAKSILVPAVRTTSPAKKSATASVSVSKSSTKTATKSSTGKRKRRRGPPRIGRRKKASRKSASRTGSSRMSSRRSSTK